MRKAIAAIQTRYGGRLFRSRLEARWSIFFDCLGIRYSYEPDGYALGAGAYLPDFWLTDLKLFLEIKGQEPTSEERAKCADLAERVQQDCLLAVGPPSMSFQIHWFDREGERDGLYCLAADRFAEFGFWLFTDDTANWIGPPVSSPYRRGGPLLEGAIEEATEAAISARFGEEWRRKSFAPIPPLPEHTAAYWLGDGPESAA